MSSADTETNSIRDRIAELVAAGDASAVVAWVEQLARERDQLLGERDQLTAKVDKKDAELVWLRRMLFGRRSEKLNPEELGQLVLAYGGSEAEAAEADPKLPVQEHGDTPPEEGPPPGRKSPKKRRPNHRGRTQLSENLERVVSVVRVPADQRTCKCCGTEMTAFDYVDHEQLEYVPAKFVVNVERREKLSCGACKGDAMTAPRGSVPDVPLRVGASVLAYLIESKCDDALPIHRQCDQFARMGFELPPSTAYGYWRYSTDLLRPVADALLGTVLEDPVWVGIDDTGIDVLDPTRKGGKFRGHLWCFRGSTGMVAYQFTETWSAKDVAPWIQLVGEDTYIQVDDYKGYLSSVETPQGGLAPVVPPDRRLGCMMHVRRRFFDALKLGDKRVAQAAQWIAELYKVEEKARGRPPDERLALRREFSWPILDAFEAWIDAWELKLGKTGTFAKAVHYAKQQRVYIRRCFEDGRLEIDNGAVERAIREPAIGRKNFLFTGSAKAGHRLADAYSLVQTCRALGLPTREYLIDVITKIERKWPARQLTELLPHRWAELHRR